jgi:sodium-dependent dicarboxylate transporter 2/3/5
VPLGAASLLPAVMLPVLGVLPAKEAALVYMDDIVMLFFGAFLVAAGLERWGVHRRMALALVDLVGTQPTAWCSASRRRPPSCRCGSTTPRLL